MKEYYNQADNRWANHQYASPTHPQANLKTSLEAFNWLGKNYNLEVKRTNNINEVYCSIENFQKIHIGTEGKSLRLEALKIEIE